MDICQKVNQTSGIYENLVTKRKMLVDCRNLLETPTPSFQTVTFHFQRLGNAKQKFQFRIKGEPSVEYENMNLDFIAN